MKQSWWLELWQGIVKNSALIIYVSMGLVTQIAIDARIKTLKWWERLIKGIIAIFVGVVTFNLLKSMGKESWTQWLVPVATLLGNSMVQWLMQNSNKYYTKFADAIITWFPKNKK